MNRPNPQWMNVHLSSVDVTSASPPMAIVAVLISFFRKIITMPKRNLTKAIVGGYGGDYCKNFRISSFRAATSFSAAMAFTGIHTGPRQLELPPNIPVLDSAGR